MEMAHSKIKYFTLLFAVLLSAPAFSQTFTWKRVPMDGHRTAANAVLSPSAQKEKDLLKSCEGSLASLKTVVGFSEKELSLYRPQCPLGNLIADILRVQTEKSLGIHCDIALFNIGGIRQILPKGNVVMDDIVSMFPFKNSVVVAKVRGDKLLELFNLMARQNWEVFSGAKVVATKESVLSVTIAGEPLDPAKVYSLVTNSFLYHGGDGLKVKALSDNSADVDTEKPILDVILDYLNDLKAQGKPIVSDVDDRLTFADGDPGKKGAHDGKSSSQVGYVQVDASASLDPKAKKRLTILHTNDTHSAIEPLRFGANAGMGGVVERAAFIDSVRKADGYSNVLLLDAGDYSQGSAYFTTFGGSVEVQAMNIMGYDVATLGNHEWDNGTSALWRNLYKAEYQTVLCNYHVMDKAFKELVKPYVIVRRGGFKIGIIGTLANITEVTDKKRVQGLSYVNPAQVVNDLAETLKFKKHCDIVIMLSHCGLESRYINDAGDVQIAPELKNVDIIIGGHTHSDLTAPVYVKGADGKPIMIVTDYCKGVYVGQLDCYK